MKFSVDYQMGKSDLEDRFKKAYPKWRYLSWQKATEIYRDIRDIGCFIILIEICEEKDLSNYPFNKDLILIHQNNYQTVISKIQGPVAQRLRNQVKQQCFKLLKQNLIGERIYSQQRSQQSPDYLGEGAPNNYANQARNINDQGYLNQNNQWNWRNFLSENRWKLMISAAVVLGSSLTPILIEIFKK